MPTPPAYRASVVVGGIPELLLDLGAQFLGGRVANPSPASRERAWYYTRARGALIGPYQRPAESEPRPLPHVLG